MLYLLPMNLRKKILIKLKKKGVKKAKNMLLLFGKVKLDVKKLSR